MNASAAPNRSTRRKRTIYLITFASAASGYLVEALWQDHQDSLFTGLWIATLIPFAGIAWIHRWIPLSDAEHADPKARQTFEVFGSSLAWALPFCIGLTALFQTLDGKSVIGAVTVGAMILIGLVVAIALERQVGRAWRESYRAPRLEAPHLPKQQPRGSYGSFGEGLAGLVVMAVFLFIVATVAMLAWKLIQFAWS